MITLFQGYEVTVPAGEFITYYKDEPLRIEDQEAELYTISSVNGDQAVLSDRSDDEGHPPHPMRRARHGHHRST